MDKLVQVYCSTCKRTIYRAKSLVLKRSIHYCTPCYPKKRLNKSEQNNIVISYGQLETCINLAKEYGVTSGAIINTLRKHGVNTTKRKLPVKCKCCDKKILRTKGAIRKTKHLFCDMVCYKAWLEVGNGKGKYKRSAFGARVARLKVSKLFDLKEGHIIHHLDRDCLNNEVNNLAVFAGQGDHVRHHRGFDVTPLWEG